MKYDSRLGNGEDNKGPDVMTQEASKLIYSFYKDETIFNELCARDCAREYIILDGRNFCLWELILWRTAGKIGRDQTARKTVRPKASRSGTGGSGNACARPSRRPLPLAADSIRLDNFLQFKLDQPRPKRNHRKRGCGNISAGR